MTDWSDRTPFSPPACEHKRLHVAAPMPRGPIIHKCLDCRKVLKVEKALVTCEECGEETRDWVLRLAVGRARHLCASHVEQSPFSQAP